MKVQYTTTVLICGLEFDVTYRHYNGCPATHTNPEDLAEVEILAVSVAAVPTADADSLLTAIKVNLRLSRLDPSKIMFDNGYDLLCDTIKQNQMV